MHKSVFIAIAVAAAAALSAAPISNIAASAASGEAASNTSHGGGKNPTEIGKNCTPEEIERAQAGFQQPHLYPPPQLFPGEERFLRNLRQLTFGGENAEAYWSPDGKKLSFQSKRDGGRADQIYILDVITGASRRVSNGQGVCTCSFFLGDNKRIVYASTFAEMPGAPPPPDYSKGYVWPVYRAYELYIADSETGEILERLTDVAGYDAECEGVDWTHGDRIVFTSARDGDLDLYALDPAKKTVERLTDLPGYDGGSFPSYDGSTIVWRRQPAKTAEEIADFRELLAAELVRPGHLEIWAMDRDGGNKRQLTDNGAANFGPNMSPGNERIVFCSNMNGGGRNFDLYVMSAQGGAAERVTFYDGFDGFPMYSPDGKYLVFASNRNGLVEGETNIFVAEWIND
ncbi:MAG: PD40 domain-containing protein [bacterium]|jgi:Tol biopolymer transport system component